MKVITEITLYKTIKGKSYPIYVTVLESGEVKVNVSQHGGSDEQLQEIVKSIADEFQVEFEVEKHVHHGHSHQHDKNLVHE